MAFAVSATFASTNYRSIEPIDRTIARRRSHTTPPNKLDLLSATEVRDSHDCAYSTSATRSNPVRVKACGLIAISRASSSLGSLSE